MGKIVLEVRDFSFKYRQTKRRALKNISFQVEKGSFFCVIGANGSGKSTLCSALAGLIPHYFMGKMAGEVFVDGTLVKDSSVAELSAKIGFVFQNPFNQLSYTAGTVAEELAYGLGNRGIPREKMAEKVEYVAKLMRIDHVLSKNPLELSGGQVQRVAFGSAFIMEPEILVLDECTTQLDPAGSEEIFDIVKRLNEKGITVIMVDHDMERVARCADKILVLDQGEAAALDEPKKIFGNPLIERHGIGVPDYVKLCRALNGRYDTGPGIEIAEEPTIKLVKEVLER
ncbi:energy-coupling factor ABC transporter ATP-binding protein [Anaerostipes sp.]|uniref:energy-coupling factor ABC transporter ATP-binding protein n=1 Tax=Anaerostipes sp. TaxID=1872530 RepID=UPI0025C60A7B|nr:ABC transporter ATP-binding protein [Anaerostipes sp.]MBS7008106.1 ABC transporter ATP-binding protein [Anaerostipes sp.]